MLEELARGEDEACLAGAGDDLDREDGVAADFEKVVSSADAVKAEDLGPDGGKDGFGRGGGGEERAAAGGVGGSGGGKGFAVEFSVRGDGEFFEEDKGGGDHVVGDAGFEEGAEGFGRGWIGAVGGDEVGAEAFFVGAVFAGEDGGFLDMGVGDQDVFNFAGFDAEAADFDLLVDAAEVFDFEGWCRSTGLPPVWFRGLVGLGNI